MSMASRRSTKYALGTVGVLLLAATLFVAFRGSATPVAKPEPASPELVAAPGVVEPVSQQIDLSFDLNGIIRQIPVKEGDRIRRGQVLAQLEDEDYRARVAEAEAQLRLKEAAFERVKNGAREQERLQAQAAVQQAEAVKQNACVERDRTRALYQAGTISREQRDSAEQACGVAMAQMEQAHQHSALVDAPPRPEDYAQAAADADLARGQLEEARAMLAKTVLRSPIDGIVLRKRLRTGESVSALTPTPVITVGDTSVLRVRVEVDEADAARVHIGQQAWVSAQAYGAKKFPGRVIRVGEVLGRKEIHTDDPAERVDIKVLECLVQLSPGTQLPIGLRVDTFIIDADSGK
jgi:HlyD family secretion protein